VTLDPSTLVTMKLESELAAAVREALRLLAVADAQQMAPLTLLTEGPAGGFDLSEHSTETNMVLLRATRDLGWTGRGLYSKDVLDPYAVWRHLRFVAFQITIRDTIFTALEDAVARAGRVLGFAATITYTGLRNHQDVTDAQSDLLSGRRPLKDLYALGP
jgi:hypothetical protein